MIERSVHLKKMSGSTTSMKFDAEGVCRFSSHTGTCVCTPGEVVTETTFRSSKGRHAVISGMEGTRSHPITMAHTCDAQVWLQHCAAGTGDDAVLWGLARAPRARQTNINSWRIPDPPKHPPDLAPLDHYGYRYTPLYPAYRRHVQIR